MTILLGGFLWYYGAFLFVPYLFAYGYIARSIRAELEGGETPEFDGWRALLEDGVRVYAIWVVFAFLLMLNWWWTSESGANGTVVVSLVGTVLGGGVLFSILPMLVGRQFDFTGMVGEPVAQSLDTYLLLVVILYIAPAMIVHVTQERNLFAGFSFTTFRPVLFEPWYARAWFGFFVRWVASAVLLYYPLLYSQQVDLAREFAGFLLIPALARDFSEYFVFVAYAVSFYLLVSAYSAIGRAWREQRERQAVAEGGRTPEDAIAGDTSGSKTGGVSE
ncbi:DUF4013 domain-containing protein [Haloprofundus halobius]|uniref:DUF4013 domain-containing protein n=1 Tax=Haloprofundus halobius TaxID=2876194 RepID=UPI001CC9596F|nr:DUF4013 domain-containing protein [Haloprofundus halobius]